MEQSKINRINELARKKKEIGLSDEEISEQKSLREEYILEIRSNVKGMLDNTSVEYPDGTKKKLNEIK